MPRNPSPDATQRSTGPSPRDRRLVWIKVLRGLILIAALYWFGKMVAHSVQQVRDGNLTLHVRPGWLALSGAFVLTTYCVLIWAWLYIIAGLSGKHIRYLDGARIWFISNVGQLLPGRVWGIIQMSAMSVEAGISPIAAAGASIINTVVNITTGLAVGILAGTPIMVATFGEHVWRAWLLAALALVGLVALPVVVPWAFRIARRLGLKIPEQRMPARLLVASVFANVIGWILYGLAFLCLNHGLVDLPRYSIVQHIAVNATSYVAGYVVLVVPAGLGVREKTLQTVMLAANMASPPQAVAVSLVSRVWQLIIMILPALIFLAYRRPPNEKGPTNAG